MKKLIAIITFALAITINAFAQDGKAIYNKYSDEKGVSAVYISPAMFRMIGRIPELNIGEDEINITPIIKSLNGFYLINIENSAVASSLRNDVNKLIGGNKFELMLEAKDDGETIRIYTVGDKKTITAFVMTAYEGNSCTFISMEGAIDRDAFEKMLASQM